ncbi:MAG: hypothetical protein ACLFVR_14980 [Thiohalospira sp.]
MITDTTILIIAILIFIWPVISYIGGKFQMMGWIDEFKKFHKQLKTKQNEQKKKKQF